MNKQEFLAMFGEKSRIDNAIRSAQRAGYDVQVEGRGAQAVYTVNKIAPDGYDLSISLEEVKLITGQKRKDRALAMFNKGKCVVVGKQVWYKSSAKRSILELPKEDRVRYLFTVKPELADEYTYEYVGQLLGISAASACYYIKKIVQKDGILEEPQKRFRTGFTQVGTRDVYTIKEEDHLFLLDYYGKGYYYSKYFLDTFFISGFIYRRYQEKPLHALNVSKMVKMETSDQFLFSGKEKNPSGKLELQNIINLLKDMN